jgi:hypothetical protein
MKNTSIILIGILVAVIVCNTQLSGFASLFPQNEVSKREQIRNISNQQDPNIKNDRRIHFRHHRMI